MKAYPTKYIPCAIIGLALTAVLTHAVIAEIFLGAPAVLYMVYAVIMGVLVFVYSQVEPFLLFTLRRRIADGDASVPASDSETKVRPELAAKVTPADDPLMKLSPKKRQVAELICLGYTNKDIAGALVISEHTVKDYVKDIYYTLEVHSRLELAALVNHYRLANKQ